MSGLGNVTDHFSLIRSKNAGPFMLTLDLFFTSGHARRAFMESDVLDVGQIADLYGVPAPEVQCFELPDINAVKISFPRPVPSGEFADNDVTGGQRYAPLVAFIAGLEISGSGADLVVRRPLGDRPGGGGR